MTPLPIREALESLKNARDVFDSLAIYVQPGSLAMLEIDQSQAAIDAVIQSLHTTEGTGWRDISEAPKDGKCRLYGRWFGTMNNGEWAWEQRYSNSGGAWRKDDTHWFDPPAPPPAPSTNGEIEA